MSITARISLRLPDELLLKNVKHVTAMPVAPMRDQLEVVGVLIDEVIEKLNRSTFALNFILLRRFVLRVIHVPLLSFSRVVTALAYTRLQTSRQCTMRRYR